MARDLTPARRGVTATPASDDLTVLRAIVAAERAIYGRVTETTARLLAERVAQDEAAQVIAKASGVQS